MTTVLALENICRHYDDGRVCALRDVSVAIAPGETVAIVGRSGSGKSTLMHMMAGLDAPSSGTVHWRGSPMAGASRWASLRASEIGIVFQAFNLLPSLSALQNVMVPMLAVPTVPQQRRQRAMELLDRVGLSRRLQHRPAELSGGERQRVAIARSLANRPALLLADEPTGNLDSENARIVVDLLLGIAGEQSMSLVIATHDAAIAARAARRIEMMDGRIVRDGAAARAAA